MTINSVKAMAEFLRYLADMHEAGFVERISIETPLDNSGDLKHRICAIWRGSNFPPLPELVADFIDDVETSKFEKVATDHGSD